MDAGRTAYDDLTKIKGIKAARQQWFQETFGVYKYADLAALTPDAIEAQLKAEGHPIALSEIERWLAQAQEFAVTKETAPRMLPQRQSNLPDKTKVWQRIAIFTVEFRELTAADQSKTYETVAQRMESDTEETWSGKTWPGIENKELCAWMLKQVADRVQQKSPESGPAASKPTPALAIPVTITQVRIFQPINAASPVAIGEAEQPIQGVITGVQPFALETTFQLGTSDATNVSLQTIYHAQFFARSLATGAKIALGPTEPAILAAGQATYIARLPQTALQPGIYRLQALVSIQTRPPSIGYLEIPLFQVV